MSDSGEGGEGLDPSTLPAVVVVDVDGVVADVSHRSHHLARRDWPAFFAAAADDPPIAAGVDAVGQAAADGFEIVFLTGRPERLRQVTVTWLERAGLPVDTERLIMRPDDDRRPARVMKVAALARLARTRTIEAVWDDDESVVDAVHKQGLPAEVPSWSQARPAEVVTAQDRLGRT